MAHIILAEDDESMCSFLRTALERAGHSVEVFNEGLAALAALEGPGVYDLLLADIVMPGMDGIELAGHATKKRPGIKVMFITGFTGVAVGDRNLQSLDAKILSKPFHLNELVRQVENILSA
jgi:two-component system cell cycle response regulator CpdR